jgi:hypothetical protein
VKAGLKSRMGEQNRGIGRRANACVVLGYTNFFILPLRQYEGMAVNNLGVLHLRKNLKIMLGR